MQLDILVLIFFLVLVSIYLLLQKQLTDLILGFALLSNSVNMIILFTSGNPETKSEPILIEGALKTNIVDPLPQALILTAIVIGFGLIAFLIILAFRVFVSYGTVATDRFMKIDSDE